jgi:hypothetical protein
VKVLAIPSACEQSLEGGVMVGDVAGRRIDDACRACVVLEKANERQVGQVVVVVRSPDGHVGRRERLLVAVVARHCLRPRPLFRAPVYRHVHHHTSIPTIKSR